MSSSSFTPCRDAFLDAVLHAPALEIKFPSGDDLNAVAHGFSRISNPHGTPVFNWCVGYVDGMLVRNYQPKYVDDPRSYFHGHSHCFGVNVQAVCDH